MKTLLKQQQDILKNYKDTDGATKKHYQEAINEHLSVIINNCDIIPFESNKTRESGNCDCSENTIMFKSIRGCFCKYCGFVFPF